jgi:prefoldin subunit 5
MLSILLSANCFGNYQKDPQLDKLIVELKQYIICSSINKHPSDYDRQIEEINKLRQEINKRICE